MTTINNSRFLGERLATGWTWWSLAAAVVFTDFATKHWVRISLSEGDWVPLTGFFNLVLLHNAGAAFSFLADAGGWQRHFLTAIALLVSVMLMWMLSSALARVEAIAYSLILGGALGNALDRISYGHVTDFLDFHWQGWHWPSFNIADIAICIGALALIGWTTFGRAGQQTQLKA